MTPKEAKKHLRRIGWLNYIINQKIRQLDELKRMASLRSVDYSADRVQSSPQDAMANMVGRWADLEAEIDRLIDTYVNEKSGILADIERIEDERYVRILCERYIDGKSLSEIAANMGYEYKWLCNLHGRALDEFAKIHKCPYPSLLRQYAFGETTRTNTN